jgi:hypothetical protein
MRGLSQGRPLAARREREHLPRRRLTTAKQADDARLPCESVDFKVY